MNVYQPVLNQYGVIMILEDLFMLTLTFGDISYNTKSNKAK